MTSLFAVSATSFLICYLILPVIIKYSAKRNIVDVPGRRKVHKKVTPSMGGIAIFIAFFTASLVWIDTTQWKEIRIILIALVMTFFIGLRDDLVPLKPVTKVIGQMMAALILVIVFNLRFHSLYGIGGITEIPAILSYLLTVFTIVIITNSYNLIDGLDGLAGTIGILSFITFGTWFFLAEDTLFAILCLSMAGALLAFLFFNWEPSQVFMGDTGAMVVGMMLAITTVYFIDSNYALPTDNPYRFHASVSAGICIIIIPLADTARIITIRLLRGQSPFKADKSHIHHSIMRLGFTHQSTTIMMGVTQLVFIGLALLLHHVSDTILLSSIVLTVTTLSILLDRLILSRLSREA